jgi:hypothetical protein
MKKDSKEVRNKMVVVRMNEREYERLHAFYTATTCRQLSDYIRKLILQKPVIVKYRNQSADEFLADMIRLKNELSAIGNNFNQAVHRLHTLDHVPEINAWLLANESIKLAFVKKVDEIKDRMNQIYQQWLQI